MRGIPDARAVVDCVGNPVAVLVGDGGADLLLELGLAQRTIVAGDVVDDAVEEAKPAEPAADPDPERVRDLGDECEVGRVHLHPGTD